MVNCFTPYLPQFDYPMVDRGGRKFAYFNLVQRKDGLRREVAGRGEEWHFCGQLVLIYIDGRGGLFLCLFYSQLWVMPNPQSKGKNLCKLYLPMSFNHQSGHRLAKLIQSPKNIEFMSNHQSARYHRKRRQLPFRNHDNFFNLQYSQGYSKSPKKQDVRWSISRMLEKAKPTPQTINFITSLYRRSGQKDIALKRKTKQKIQDRRNLAKNAFQFKSIVLKPKETHRYSKTAETKERPQPEIVKKKMRTINISRRQPRLNITRQKQRSTHSKGVRTFSRAENWVVDSWNTTIKYDNVCSQI